MTSGLRHAQSSHTFMAAFVRCLQMDRVHDIVELFKGRVRLTGLNHLIVRPYKVGQPNETNVLLKSLEIIAAFPSPCQPNIISFDDWHATDGVIDALATLEDMGRVARAGKLNFNLRSCADMARIRSIDTHC